MLDGKARIAGGTAESAFLGLHADLVHLPASAADEKRCTVALQRMAARKKRLCSPQLVDEPLLDQKVERAVGHGRLSGEANGGQPLQNVVGAKRALCIQKDLERVATMRRQALTTRCTEPFGRFERALG